MTMTEDRAGTGTIEQLWQDLLDRDDRTSPPEYPDMALITFDEFAEIHRVASLRASPQGEAEFEELLTKEIGRRLPLRLSLKEVVSQALSSVRTALFSPPAAKGEMNTEELKSLRALASDAGIYALGKEGRPTDEQFQNWSVAMHKAADTITRVKELEEEIAKLRQPR